MTAAVAWLDRMVARSERLGWAVLVAAAVLLPWLQLELPPTEGPTGNVAADVALMLALWAATAAQCARIAFAPPAEHVTFRIASYLLLITLAMFSGRLTWIVLSLGAADIAWTAKIAMLCLCASVLINAVGRVMYARK